MGKRAIAVLLAVLLLVTLFPAVSASETVPCLTVDSSLVIIGDSNTVFLKKNNPDIQPARIYARVNATVAECASNYSRYHADGYNYGIYQLITALKGDSFRTVVINIGTNNAGTPSESLKSDYRKLLNLFYGKNPNAVIYLCKILPINPAKYNGSYPQVFTKANIDRINAAVVEVQQEFAAQGYDARIMDLNAAFSNAAGVLMPEYDSGGGIHLNVAGYKRLNRVVQTKLAQGDDTAAHTWSEKVETPATCAEPGVLKQTCSVCGAERTKPIPATGKHTWKDGSVLQAPTCAKTGLRQKVCSVCGAETTEVIPATGNHTWKDGSVLQAPTCTKTGQRQKVCAVCGAETTEIIPATGIHNWNDGKVIAEPTCTASGVLRRVCTSCRAEMEEVVAPLGHAWTLTERLTEEETLHACTASYTCARCGAVKEAALCAGEIFTDMPKKSHWAHDAIDWAWINGLTGGTSATTFSPNRDVTRGEAVTFLYSLADKPEVEAENPFRDVKKRDFYYNAVLWAAEQGITGGTTETTFSPKNTCTRGEIVLFLWAAAGRPEPENRECRFEDVKQNAFYYDAVLWAVEQGVTGGIDEAHFGPKANCTRAQLMLFLKAACPILTAEEPPEELEPEDPTDPTDPTNPEDPTDPTDPTNPEDPTDPTNPEDPTDPSEPAPEPEPEQP